MWAQQNMNLMRCRDAAALKEQKTDPEEGSSYFTGINYIQYIYLLIHWYI